MFLAWTERLRRPLRAAALALAAGLFAGHVSSEPRLLRVCADPANLPFSDDHLRGFENQIAGLVARELGAELRYTWRSQRRGFVRNTLAAQRCDVIVGIPAGATGVRTTRSYYRSTFAFVTRASSTLRDLSSLDDPRLESVRVGVPLAGDDGANPAPALLLSRRGARRLVGFSLWDEYRRETPAAVQALLDGRIDVAVLWGPVAGVATRERSLSVRPLHAERDGDIPLAFSIAMGVRQDDVTLAERLDEVLGRRAHDIEAILRAHGVPLLPLGEEAAFEVR